MFVFPMAGLSSRFSEAGYYLPKYMLKAHGHSIFWHAVSSFSAYFNKLPFLFILRDFSGSADFVLAECHALGIADVRVVVLEGPTSGQAETVKLGLKKGGGWAESLTIFNIDTIRPGFRFPDSFDIDDVDGYLEVFRGSGSNWSYVRPFSPESDSVVETTEKIPISDLCCTGLYHFRSVGMYLNLYKEFFECATSAMSLKEKYIAPMYNLLIRDHRDIRYSLVSTDDVIFCGVPKEYEEFKVRNFLNIICDQ